MNEKNGHGENRGDISGLFKGGPYQAQHTPNLPVSTFWKRTKRGFGEMDPIMGIIKKRRKVKEEIWNKKRDVIFFAISIFRTCELKKNMCILRHSLLKFYIFFVRYGPFLWFKRTTRAHSRYFSYCCALWHKHFCIMITVNNFSPQFFFTIQKCLYSGQKNSQMTSVLARNSWHL